MGANTIGHRSLWPSFDNNETTGGLVAPHVAILGTPYRQKWEAILLENCRRFAAGQPLLNVVDKEKWY